MNSNKFWTAMSKALAVVAVTLMVTMMLAPSSAGQAKYKNLHTFNSHWRKGHTPYAGLTFDAAGNLYGTTERGGADTSCGTVFKLSPKPDGSWSHTVLYSFLTPHGGGCQPQAGLTFDKQGNLYGTTVEGGSECRIGRSHFGCGTVFKLTHNPDDSWSETVLHDFGSESDSGPQWWGRIHRPYAGLVFDTAGNLYGTTSDYALTQIYATVFKLTPNADGSWTKSVIYTMANWSVAAVVFDAAGNLYGTTESNVFRYGTYQSNVFKLTQNPDGSWTPAVLYTFTGGADGGSPYAGLVFDSAGKLYGTTVNGGAYGYGVVFQLTPNTDGTWSETVLHQFTGGKDGSTPYAGVSLDKAGNLYGTASAGGVYGYGAVFKLASGKNGTWTQSVVHAFKGKPGAYPMAGVIFDATGSLYGTTKGEWTPRGGSVFEITP